MEFGELFHVLRSRWRLLAASVVVILCVAVGYRLIAAPKYKAVASVLVDPRGINPVSGAATQQPLSQDSVVGTYANVARTEGVARSVVGRLPGHATAELRERWERDKADAPDASFDVWAARRLMRNLDVRAGGQSSHVLDISYVAADRATATEVANLYADELVAYSRRLRTSAAQQDADYFKTQALSLRKETEEAERQLVAFQRQYGFTGSGERVDVEAAGLAALNTQTILSQDLSYDSTARARQAAASTSMEIVNNELVQQLSADLVRKEAKLQELSIRFADGHPEMKSAKEQVSTARAALARESRNVAEALRSSSIAAQSRATSLKSDSEAQRQRLVELNARRVELGSLDKDVQQKRKLYEAALQRSTEATLEAGSQRADLQLLVRATPPETRTGPGLAITLPLAPIAGLLIGAFAALCLHRMRPRLHRAADLEDIGLPVLEVIPFTRFPLKSGGNMALLGNSQV